MRSIDGVADRRRALVLISSTVPGLAGCWSRVPPPLPTPTAPTNAGRVTPTAPPVDAPGNRLARNWDEFRTDAARRLVAANAGITYLGTPPEPLLAIPVLEVELNASGSVRRIRVLRQPSQARDTTQAAIDAVNRAAPFGRVGHLPKPWIYTEAFLFDDNRRFKPRTLD